MRFGRGMRVEDPAEVEAYRDRLDRMMGRGKWQGGGDISAPPAPDEGKEARLQGKCEKWLKDRGYCYVHDRSKKMNKRGEILDLYCFLPEGRVVIMELKSKDGGMSPEQRQTYRMLKYLKHEVYEVRSFKQFLQIMQGLP